MASRLLARLGSETKDRVLLNIAAGLKESEEEILAANDLDCAQGKRDGLDAAFLDRLLLNPQRLTSMAEDVRRIAELPDPVGETFDMRVMPNGLQVGKRRVPLGVIGTIYESRPNVTVDISVLCLKSGNAVVLRGGKESLHSNIALASVVRKSLGLAGAPKEAVQLVESSDRALVQEMLQLREFIDLMVPRGGEQLIRFVAANATMPVISGGVGVCHTYVDSSAKVDMAKAIIYNAKVQRPSVCNALDTVLVHKDIASEALPPIAAELAKAGVELRCDLRALSILQPTGIAKVRAAQQDDWGKEFLALIAAVKIVDGLDDALGHIERYGSGHSEAIITEDYTAATRFMNEVDAAAVYVNASTRFTDGGQLGLGAEVGISTQKFHARGPMGLREMTSYKWTIFGTGQVRP
ncbi:MAG: proA [Dehalococcoidia bacterium]|nr:proA [Dehalococcoidia bacterium]